MPQGSSLSSLRLAQGETARWKGPCNVLLEDYQSDIPRKPCGLAQEAMQFPETHESPDHPNLWRLRYEVHGAIYIELSQQISYHQASKMMEVIVRPGNWDLSNADDCEMLWDSTPCVIFPTGNMAARSSAGFPAALREVRGRRRQPRL